MTVSTALAAITYTGNGVATNFPFPFKLLDTDHLHVSKILISSGAVTPVNQADYTINYVDGADSGSIDYAPALASTHQLYIERIVPYTQDTDIDNEGGFFPEVIEEQLDAIVMMIQQLNQAVANLVDGGTGVSLTGMVAGPAIATDDNFASFNGVGGNIIQDSGFSAASFALAGHTHNNGSNTEIICNKSIGTGTQLIIDSSEIIRAYNEIEILIDSWSHNSGSVRAMLISFSCNNGITIAGPYTITAALAAAADGECRIIVPRISSTQNMFHAISSTGSVPDFIGSIGFTPGAGGPINWIRLTLSSTGNFDGGFVYAIGRT